MNSRILTLLVFLILSGGCSSTKDYLEDLSPFKSEEKTLEPKKGAEVTETDKYEQIFVCSGDINVVYKNIGQVSLGEYGFSGHDVLAKKIKEKAFLVGAQAVINVQYDTGYAKTWRSYGELGGTDLGVSKTSWVKGTGIVFAEKHDPLGLIVCSLTKENKEWFRFKSGQKGVLVVSVFAGSVAANSGIKPEDLIVEWNGEEIATKKQFIMLTNTSVNKEVKLTILRPEGINTVNVLIPAADSASQISQAPESFQQKSASLAVPNEPAAKKSELKSSEVHNEIGDLFLRKGMYREALEEYKNAIEVDPYMALSHFNLSIAYEKLGMKREADEEFAIYKKLKNQKN
ncbi:MAG: PDZ domain-containing protein [Candidatus Kuenenia sp.]|nr:PDZ domain-containing protein [Candidatus Kuenenia hertensis]